MQDAGRRDGVVRMTNDLKNRGLRIDAIGMQGHMGLDYPTITDYEKSMNAFAGTGAKIHITEWDMTALPTVNMGANIADRAEYESSLNPYPETLPDSVAQLWNARMRDFFELFMKHSDVVERVTVWGVSDGDSWKNNWPIRGRKEYPLIFDRDYQPKPFIQEMLSANIAIFDEFIYEVPVPGGQGEIVDSLIANPILPGCYPDPSICRVGDDYYLVNSSFAYFPAIPIWHSTDLKNWNQLGYVLNRPSQLPMREGLRISGGIYAPDIKYNPDRKSVV